MGSEEPTVRITAEEEIQAPLIETHEHAGVFKECHQQRNRLRAIYFAFLVWDSCVLAIPPSPRLRHAQAKEEEAETL
jgi:hypothetical protein